MVRLASEVTHDETIASVDELPTIRRVVSLAERGFWDIRLKLPSGRRLSVRQLVKLWGLDKYLRTTAL